MGIEIEAGQRRRWRPYFLVPAVVAAWALCMVLLWLRVCNA